MLKRVVLDLIKIENLFHLIMKSGGGGNFIISSSCVGLAESAGGCAPMCLDGYCVIYSFHRIEG